MPGLVPIRPAVANDRENGASDTEHNGFARRVWITVGIVAAVALGILAVWAGRAALLLIYVSLLIATGLLPMIRRIELAAVRHGMTVPRWLVMGIVYAAFLGVVFVAGVLIVPPILTQTEDLARRLPNLLASWQSGLVRHGLLARPMTITDAMQQSAPAAPAGQEPIALAATAVRQLAGWVIELVTVLILTFYMLMDGSRVATELSRAVPLRHRTRVLAVARDVTSRVSAWLQGNLIIGAIMGSATALAMGLLGEPYFWVVALVAAIAEFVPIAGPLLAGLFAVMLALTVSLNLAFSVGIVFIVLHEVEANILVPKIMGRQVGLSSLAVFLALLLGAEWFGLAGAILAIPSTAIVSSILEELRKSPPDRPVPAQQGR
jgi:predicted PurR-regulated permease PerM